MGMHLFGIEQTQIFHDFKQNFIPAMQVIKLFLFSSCFSCSQTCLERMPYKFSIGLLSEEFAGQSITDAFAFKPFLVDLSIVNGCIILLEYKISCVMRVNKTRLFSNTCLLSPLIYDLLPELSLLLLLVFVSFPFYRSFVYCPNATKNTAFFVFLFSYVFSLLNKFLVKLRTF